MSCAGSRRGLWFDLACGLLATGARGQAESAEPRSLAPEPKGARWPRARAWPCSTCAAPPLIAGGLVHRIVRPQASSACALAWSLPLDMSLVGVELHAQGLCLGGSASLGHAGQRSAHLSNALELRLGF